MLVPALVRPKQGGGYEMVAGYRGKMTAWLAHPTEIPCIAQNRTNEEATIINGIADDSPLHRRFY